MATSFYDLSAASYLQTAQAMAVILEKGLAFCRERGIDPGDIVESRLFSGAFSPRRVCHSHRWAPVQCQAPRVMEETRCAV